MEGGRLGGDEEGFNSVGEWVFFYCFNGRVEKGAYLSQYSRNLLKS